MVQVTNGIGLSGKAKNNILPRQFLVFLLLIRFFFFFFKTVSTDIIAKLQKQPPPSHENHHVPALGWEGDKGNSTLFFGINGDAFQVSFGKPPWVGGGHLNDNLYLDACRN